MRNVPFYNKCVGACSDGGVEGASIFRLLRYLVRTLRAAWFVCSLGLLVPVLDASGGTYLGLCGCLRPRFVDFVPFRAPLGVCVLCPLRRVYVYIRVLTHTVVLFIR